MGKRTRPITIYRTKPRRRPRFRFQVSRIHVIVFFSILSSLSLFVSIFLLTSHSVKASSHVLSAQIVDIHRKPTQSRNIFPLIPLTVAPVVPVTVMPTPRPDIIQPEIIASEDAKTLPMGDYCLRLPIIMYHHVQPLAIAEKLGHAPLTVDSKYFELQMAYLDTGGYHSISSADLVDALIHHTSLPEKSVMLTFDDGYDDMYAYVFPLLEKYHLIGNFMIPTGLMGVKGYLTWDELKDMQKSPYVSIYNHTWSHADLKNSSHDKIEAEMTMSQSQLETNLGIKPDIMAYPYGSFNDEAKQILKEHGFIAAFSTIGGLEQCESQILELRRVHAGNSLEPPLSF